MPWIDLRRLTGEQTPEEVDHEWNLRQTEGEGAHRDEHVDRLQVVQEGVLHRVVDAPHVPADAEDVHRKEGAVEGDERRPEMDLAERLVHHAAEHLRKPVVDGGKNAEDAAA